VKSQIVYHGEIMYQTTAIEKKAAELNQEILISENLMQRISLPSLYKMVKVAEMDDGKLSKIDLYTIKEIDPVNAPTPTP